jgi:hypothetical protein
VGARSAALEAFETQGPRLARVLESIAKGAPGELSITTLVMTSAPGVWRITLNGQAFAETPALAQATFNQFLRGATSSPLLGPPLRPPQIVVEETPPPSGAALGGASGARGAGSQLGADEISPHERPRGVIVEDGFAGLSAAERRAADLLGRRPIRVRPEPHWYLHPGGVPKHVQEGIERYNVMQATVAQHALREAGLGPQATIQGPRAASMLDFTVELEVRK